ncbi:ankyrin-containing protein [Acanthamoeba polyphaga mimivirus]|nr:ankyrin-containing protein [Acanthamoeba polyphaga mimivirus]
MLVNKKFFGLWNLIRDDIDVIDYVLKYGCSNVLQYIFWLKKQNSPLISDAKFNPNYVENLNILLIKCCCYGRLSMVKYLVAQGVNVDAQNSRALCLACKYGYINIAYFLMHEGANIYANDNHPIRLAAEYGHLSIVKLLIYHNANIRAVEDSALRMAAKRNKLEVVKYIIEKIGTNYEYSDYPLAYAAGKGHIEMIEYLLSIGEKITDYAMFMAINNGHVGTVKYLIDESQSLPCISYSELAKITRKGHLEMIKLLNNRGIKINKIVNTTIINETIEKERWEILEYFNKIGVNNNC